MTALKKIVVSKSIFSISLCNELLKQLSRLSVTNLNIKDISDLTQCTSALQTLINPLTGTLEELCVSGEYIVFQRRPKFIRAIMDDAPLLDVVCAQSSLKSLQLVHPRDISSLTLLQANTRLTRLELICHYADISRVVEVMVEILKHNKTLQDLKMESFKLPQDIHALRDIVEAGSNKLRSIAIEIAYDYVRGKFQTLSDYMKAEYPQLSGLRCRKSSCGIAMGRERLDFYWFALYYQH